ncbi:hypothetical protein PUNSTDRAFT_138718 [Punctularia strigosozonata HHB-11173 SS5]|uniref:Uncharacterized protein n=1 Tax=Punctularia strigosozonata (strain HHB-11173) TaxID=741275 RepID=R7S396_PUNST|nr:uncharacterized protein PUNSTDRAFT_138718 [Punctularia strigosozonata HHB-11173 SS5]EIN04324.1 hypothetical protein PUNSTDRAFT_138718 [Punctularia strigosozonata HHB-11173 SS5]
MDVDGHSVLAQFYVGEDRTAESGLSAQLMKAFIKGGFVNMAPVPSGLPNFVVINRLTPLLENGGPGFRFKGIDFVWFADAAKFWPPPLALGGLGSSAGWVFSPTDGDLTSECAELLLDGLADLGPRAIFGLYEPQAGSTKKWYLRANGPPVTAHSDFERMGVNFKWAPHCAFCMSRPDHMHTDCPFIGTINKVRAKAGFIPLKMVNGAFSRVDKEAEMDVEGEVKGMKERMEKMDARINSLAAEVKALGKRKADKPAKDTPKEKKQKKGGAAPDAQANTSQGGSGDGKKKNKGGDKAKGASK